ncbi:glycosyltransferase family 2 protein [Bacteriovorax sp. Seq25_V]|uniref:glycosyltransferase family 2 protein n=1 Tax=Bacteriovorax sp. Seq25_V TaxID=1201288 RepID=UPI00038A43CA|nr:glycosyltransferase family 2 protein [Bacteriovorax sp. Seq25_V]EQC46798.1 glycosyltransferase, group 2 family protein [Bacteriovorax sp. Seq25_V]
MSTNIDLSIVVPFLNEELVLNSFFENAFKKLESSQISFEIIGVDNGSIDSSYEIAQRFPVKLVKEKMRGYGAALKRGFIESRGQYIAYLDCDGSYTIEDLIALYQEIREKGSDKVIGTRINDKSESKAMPLLHRYVGTPMLNLLCFIRHGLRTNDVNSGLRVFRSSILKKMSLSSDGMEFASEFLIKCYRSNFQIHEVPISYGRGFSTSRRPHLRPLRDGCRHFLMILKS